MIVQNKAEFKDILVNNSLEIGNNLQVSNTLEVKDILVENNIKIENDSNSESWRFGTMRLDIQPDGRR